MRLFSKLNITLQLNCLVIKKNDSVINDKIMIPKFTEATMLSYIVTWWDVFSELRYVKKVWRYMESYTMSWHSIRRWEVWCDTCSYIMRKRWKVYSGKSIVSRGCIVRQINPSTTISIRISHAVKFFWSIPKRKYFYQTLTEHRLQERIRWIGLVGRRWLVYFTWVNNARAWQRVVFTLTN